MIVGEVTTMITRLYLMPTHNCNCKCVYCYIPENEKHKKSDGIYLQSVVNRFMNHLEKSNDNQDPEIRFIGGEPYLNKKFLINVSNQFLSQFSTGKIIVNTNGTLLNIGIIEQVAPINRKRFVNIISLDGIEDVHNARRLSKKGLNTFQQTVQGIKLLKSMNMPVYLNMVLDEFTVSKLDKFMRYLKNKLDIHELSVSLLFDPKNPLSDDVKFELIKEAYRLAKNNDVLIGGHHRLLLGFQNNDFMCKAGKKTVLISSDNKAYACQRFVGRVEADIFNEDVDFGSIELNSCVDSECYSEVNKQLGKKIFQLYSNGMAKYRTVNWFDKILFGVI